MKSLFGFLLAFVVISGTQAQVDQTKEISTSQTFGAYTVHYNVFNSTDIPPQVAQAYKLVRGKDRALVNISLTKTENGATSLGLPAQISGKTRDLMQRQQQLKFIEIKEGDATYYLAPFVFNSEELLYFDIDISADKNARPMKVSFNRTLYK